MSASPNSVDRIESAADITLVIGDIEVPIAELDRTKEVEVTQHRQNSLKANGYSVDMIDYSGSASFKGERISGPDGRARLDDLIYDDEGAPVPVDALVIQHQQSGDDEVFEDVLFVSDGYNVSEESASETAYDWVAMRKAGDEA
jgi:hypothetical protein